jgi:hypothetical protein
MRDNDGDLFPFPCIFIYCRRYSEGTLGGSMGDIFEIMRQRMNFTYQTVRSIDGNYGARVIS